MSEENKPAEEKPATSAEVVESKWLPHHKKLESRISILEDQNKTLKEQNDNLVKSIEGLKIIPSKTNPTKSLWDELEEFMFIPEIKTVIPEKKD